MNFFDIAGSIALPLNTVSASGHAGPYFIYHFMKINKFVNIKYFTFFIIIYTPPREILNRSERVKAF